MDYTAVKVEAVSQDDSDDDDLPLKAATPAATTASEPSKTTTKTPSKPETPKTSKPAKKPVLVLVII